MTWRQYLFWMFLLTALCWIGWSAVVEAVDPSAAGPLGFLLFYAALGLALFGTFSLIGALIRAAARRHESPSRHVATSSRQGLLLALLMVGALALQGRSLLTWWNLLLFIGTLTAIEFFLISFRSRP